jgi:hypothetical protein
MTDMLMKAKTDERNRSLAEPILRTDFKPSRILGKLSALPRFLSLGNDSIMTNDRIVLIADDV